MQLEITKIILDLQLYYTVPPYKNNFMWNAKNLSLYTHDKIGNMKRKN